MCVCVCVCVCLIPSSTACACVPSRLQKEAELPGIVTFCQDMDRMLGGGVQLGEITEFCTASPHHPPACTL